MERNKWKIPSSFDDYLANTPAVLFPSDYQADRDYEHMELVKKQVDGQKSESKMNWIRFAVSMSVMAAILIFGILNYFK